MEDLTLAVDQLLDPRPGQALQTELQAAASSIIAKVRVATLKSEIVSVEQRIRDATGYMDRAIQRGRALEPVDIERLQIMLPHLWRNEDDKTRYVAALLSANVLFNGPDVNNFWFTGDGDTDSVIRGIMQRIARYVREFGPPPFDVPIEHLPLFGLFASACATFGEVGKGIEAWQQLGALQGRCLDLAPIESELLAIQSIGLEGMWVRRFNDALDRNRDTSDG